MSRAICIVALFPSLLLAQEQPAGSPAVNSFPNSDFTLRDHGVKAQKSGVVLGPIGSDGKEGSKASFAFYGGPSMIQVTSLSFSGDGKTLAAASTPGHVDVWDIEKQTKLYSLDGGTTVAISPDGRLLAKDGNGIEICDAATGRLIRRIPWSITTSTPGVQRVIKKLGFNAAGNQFEVSSNGEDDLVFDVSSGQLVATLKNTQEGQFSRDGSVFVGGNGKHLIAWRTNDWSKVSDVPNGPDYVTQIAAFPEKDLAIVRGPNSARLIHISSGENVAKVGSGYTNFASFNQDGTSVFAHTSGGSVFGIPVENNIATRRISAMATPLSVLMVAG